MQNNSTPMELSAEDIKAGINKEITVILKSNNEAYDGKAVRVRPLRASEFRSLSQRVKIGNDADLGDLYAFNYMACSVKATKTTPGAILTLGIVENLDSMDADIINQLGDAIISISQPAEEKILEDFSTPAKDS
ncbi:MAG: hypothetical protein ACYDG4_15085 [Desulfuromonadaceae bacterium]